MPSGWDLAALVAAKQATGYQGLVEPRPALPGSPQPILAVGIEPDWLTRYAYLPSLLDVERTTAALTAILMNPEDTRIADEIDLMSKWFGGEVKYLGEEPVNG
jgi:hypothetical protein